MRELTVNENDANQRLDKFLTKYMDIPSGMLYKGLRKNCVRVNGKHVKQGDYTLQAGDTLSLYFKDEFFSEPKKFIPIKPNLKIIFEDENILLIDKEVGTVVHADDCGTKDTLIYRIQSYLFEKGEYDPDNEHSFSPALCNRLDRNTGGIIIAAKNAAALRIINEKIKKREIKKLYLCIVEGRPKDYDELSSYLTRGEKIVSVSDTASKDAKPIKTRYRVIAGNKKSSLVEVELLTGRTHQIRAQLAYIGHPLAGDVKYGAKKTENYHTLYSYKLIFGFTSDAGILNYLNGREFSVSVEFANKFLAANS
ncbi:MAG: RluA family pseudouridine synthase [Oscillospiraceae bacterium]|nr:RluA family pseudouridine synthase [Oscillospiraceae bacterium]